jgi:hypothetical protein
MRMLHGLRRSRFKMGRKGVYPPMFFEERESGFESVSCGMAENKSVQAIENAGFNERVYSKREGDFIYEYSLKESTCQ